MGEVHVSLFQDREKEQADLRARTQNLRIVGLSEDVKEDPRSTVLTLFREIQVQNLVIKHASWVGRLDTDPRALLVRFPSNDAKEEVLHNRAMLQERRVWLDPDLMPTQLEERKKEISKVKTATAARWIAYLKDGRAVVTTHEHPFAHIAQEVLSLSDSVRFGLLGTSMDGLGLSKLFWARR
ncbi:hypothetical protein R1sor_009506 [Riccia sorocarpa]|uniref:Uncharacterized protein n=1 Tax=Riccia sorocarpa TaxID=122646 RepID=A0ABD3HV94_9MARC